MCLSVIWRGQNAVQRQWMPGDSLKVKPGPDPYSSFGCQSRVYLLVSISAVLSTCVTGPSMSPVSSELEVC